MSAMPRDAVAYQTQQFNLKELDIFGCRNALPEDFRSVIAYLEARREPPDDLITKVFPLAEAEHALPYWDGARDATMKILIEC